MFECGIFFITHTLQWISVHVYVFCTKIFDHVKFYITTVQRTLQILFAENGQFQVVYARAEYSLLA